MFKPHALRILLGLALVGAGCHATPTSTLPVLAAGSEAAALGVHANEVLVKTLAGSRDAWLQPGWRVVRTLEPLGWKVVSVGTDSVMGAIARLKQDGRVQAAEPQRLMHFKDAKPVAVRQGVTPTAAPDPATNDPDLAKQLRYFDRIKLTEAWKATGQGAATTIVAVLDTGVDASHPDLQGQLLPGYDFFNDKPEPKDDNSHGTACIGLLAAATNNHVGIAGVAPKIKVLPVKVLDRLGNGPLEICARGMVWSADHGAKIISFSSGEDAPSAVLQDAIDYCRKQDVMVLAAMGNDGENVQHWPACCPGVLAVGATYTEDDTPALFTTEGNWVGIAAPGDMIWTTRPTYPCPNPLDEEPLNYSLMAGTSASCPIVAGVAALVRTRFPQLTEGQVRARLQATADDVGPKGVDDLTGAGRVNALRALTAPL